MIACDTSSLINFLKGGSDTDSDQVRTVLRADELWLPPPVRTELLSRSISGASADELLAGARLLPINEGFWDRAGHSRRRLVEKGLKARLADTLIAQCCIDAEAPLITRDADFRHFERWCGLRLA